MSKVFLSIFEVNEIKDDDVIKRPEVLKQQLSSWHGKCPTSCFLTFYCILFHPGVLSEKKQTNKNTNTDSTDGGLHHNLRRNIM